MGHSKIIFINLKSYVIYTLQGHYNTQVFYQHVTKSYQCIENLNNLMMKKSSHWFNNYGPNFQNLFLVILSRF